MKKKKKATKKVQRANFTPRLFRTEERARMKLGKEDREKWDNEVYEASNSRKLHGKIIWIGPLVDLLSGKSIMVTPAPCGLNCYCDAEYKLVKKAKK